MEKNQDLVAAVIMLRWTDATEHPFFYKTEKKYDYGFMKHIYPDTKTYKDSIDITKRK